MLYIMCEKLLVMSRLTSKIYCNVGQHHTWFLSDGESENVWSFPGTNSAVLLIESSEDEDD